MSNEEASHGSFLFVYPMVGMEIADETFELQNMMFGDASLLSPSMFKKLPDVMGERQATAGHYLAHLTADSKASCYIAVRRTAHVPPPVALTPGWKDRLGQVRVRQECLKPIELGAWQRAAEIVAALAIATYLEGRSPCALMAQAIQSPRAHLAIELARGHVRRTQEARGLLLTGGSRGHVPFSLTRRQLQDMLDREPAAGVCRVLRNRRGRNSSGRSIVDSALVLTSAMHKDLPASQLLEAVTAVECLLSEGKNDWGGLERRTRALLGQEVADKYDVSCIFGARHAWVHTGSSPGGILILRDAIALSLSCLLRFAQIAPRFKCKRHVLAYLDFLHQGDRMADAWTDVEKAKFAELVVHDRRRFGLECLH